MLLVGFQDDGNDGYDDDDDDVPTLSFSFGNRPESPFPTPPPPLLLPLTVVPFGAEVTATVWTCRRTSRPSKEWQPSERRCIGTAQQSIKTGAASIMAKSSSSF
mmetsp:Transcript_13035/g.36099  ORF Transcript_13035/g.36099 Transcript_13035/m.36099 type:complete len:104 (-) Transcript_13035:428-739(-)